MMKKVLKVISLVLVISLTASVFAIGVYAKSADYSELYTYLDTCIPTNNDAGIYSDESYNTLMNVVDSVDYSLTSEQQADVDNYLSSIKSAVANLETDETKAVASYGISLSKNNAECGDTIDVYVTLDTNYSVYAASAIILYDSNVFDIECESTSPTAYLDYSGALENYLHLGNWKSPSTMYSRNNNPTYWTTMQDSLKIAYIGWSADSSMGEPTISSGTVAKFSLKVRNDLPDGTTGRIFMNSDWYKTAQCKGGMTFVSRTVGNYFSSASDAAIPYGQTINISDASQTVTIGEPVHVCSTGTWSVTTSATCTEDGLKTMTCDECGKVMETEAISATGHNYEATVIAPTCTENGYTKNTCSYCGNSYNDNEVTALGHTWGEWTETKAPTSTASGVKTRTCTVCGEKETSETPKLTLVANSIKVLRSRVSLEGNSIKVTSYNNAYNLVIYTTTTDNKTVDIDRTNTPITKMSNGSGFVLTHVNWAKAGSTEVKTTITVDGNTYNLIVTFVDVTLTSDYIKALRTYGSEVDTTAKTITITSATDAQSIDLYQYSDVDHSFEIVPTKIDGTSIVNVTSTRYRINKTESTLRIPVVINRSRYCQENYTLIVNFVSSPFNPAKYIRPIYGAIELANDGEDYILVTMKNGSAFTGIMAEGIGGATLALDYESVDGTLDKYTKNGAVTQYRAYSDKNIKDDVKTPVRTNITINLEDGTQVSYRIVFAFEAAGFSASVLNTTNVQNIYYESSNSKLRIEGSGDTFITIRKTTFNGLNVEIENVDAYSNIVENDTLYLIYTPASGIFNCVLNISDGTKVNATLMFKSHAEYDETTGIIGNDFINTGKITATKGYVEYGDGQLMFKIKAGKTSMIIGDTVYASGESIVIPTGNGISYADGNYTITSALLGQHINITISGLTYDVLITR